ncbi:sensor domain-containing protein [Streptomyces sp. CBMA152]|uniref:sensor histidine kinase n=1 Tax=Streptomyces sp. CBMA152 TaxID=1896312 RepID=UPI001660FA17|nr:sensor domain-containing protein [Streptomyces sp. CBMA152]MBD0746994.1 histidine kinase [Streptomyces sp. CBMA152]
MVKKIRAGLLAGGRGFGLATSGMAVGILLFTLAVVSISLIPIGVGVLTTPAALDAVRVYANRRRSLAHEWLGMEIAVPYRALPGTQRAGLLGTAERCGLLLKDPATWRDLEWLFADMTAGAVVALLAPCLLLYSVWGIVLAAGVWKPIDNAGGGLWFTFVHITSQPTANLAAVLGVVYAFLGLFVNPYLVRANFAIARSLLSPTREQALALRVERLTETRHDAVDSSAAELRRIERDLHDGAQARLVAMGMNLGTIEALIEKDPEQAKLLLAKARESSAEALTELRDLVRGIHPPVLAERGLGDAVRALALRMPVMVDVDVELPPGRAEAPVESAAYFAVSELLTNAVKHAEADRIWVDLSYAGGALRLSVTDNGRGGANVGGGSGLSGVERRLGTFDGVLAVSSPVGGPTMVTVEIPCALS